MDQHYLQKQLDLLWSKVKGKVDNPGRGDFISAFEEAQAQIQAEAIENLKMRFEKEKAYWENLLAAKDETLNRLQLELREELKKNQEYKNKIVQMQESEGGLLEQSFATLELQKKSLNARIEHLEAEVQSARTDFVSLKFRMDEEAEDGRRAAEFWNEKENQWNQVRDALEAETHRLKDQLNQTKEAHVEEISRLDQAVRDLERQKREQEELFTSDKKGLDNLLSEKSAQADKLSDELNALRRELEADRETRRQASVERERRAVQEEEDRKRMVEQLLTREKKIKELEESLENLIKEQDARKELLRRREETIRAQEELLSRRREDWVESVKGQASQQLNLSGKVIDLLNKLEGKTVPADIPGGVPSLPASLLARSREQTAAAAGGAWARWLSSTTGEKLIMISIVFAVLLMIGSGIYFLGSEGRRASKAQKYLMRGNELYTNGALDESIKLLEKGYKLDPDNSIIKNSYTLVLGELASRDFANGQYEEALAKTEMLNRIIPEDPDVVKLYNDILQSLGRRNKSKSSEPRAPMSAPMNAPMETISPPQTKADRPPMEHAPPSRSAEETDINQEL